MEEDSDDFSDYDFNSPLNLSKKKPNNINQFYELLGQIQKSFHDKDLEHFSEYCIDFRFKCQSVKSDNFTLDFLSSLIDMIISFNTELGLPISFSTGIKDLICSLSIISTPSCIPIFISRHYYQIVLSFINSTTEPTIFCELLNVIGNLLIDLYQDGQNEQIKLIPLDSFPIISCLNYAMGIDNENNQIHNEENQHFDKNQFEYNAENDFEVDGDEDEEEINYRRLIQLRRQIMNKKKLIQNSLEENQMEEEDFPHPPSLKKISEAKRSALESFIENEIKKYKENEKQKMRLIIDIPPIHSFYQEILSYIQVFIFQIVSFYPQGPFLSALLEILFTYLPSYSDPKYFVLSIEKLYQRSPYLFLRHAFKNNLSSKLTHFLSIQPPFTRNEISNIIAALKIFELMIRKRPVKGTEFQIYVDECRRNLPLSQIFEIFKIALERQESGNSDSLLEGIFKLTGKAMNSSEMFYIGTYFNIMNGAKAIKYTYSCGTYKLKVACIYCLSKIVGLWDNHDYSDLFGKQEVNSDFLPPALQISVNLALSLIDSSYDECPLIYPLKFIRKLLKDCKKSTASYLSNIFDLIEEHIEEIQSLIDDCDEKEGMNNVISEATYILNALQFYRRSLK